MTGQRAYYREGWMRTEDHSTYPRSRWALCYSLNLLEEPLFLNDLVLPKLLTCQLGLPLIIGVSNGVSLFFIQSLLFYREGLRLRESGASNGCPISLGCQVSCGQRKTQLPFFSAVIKLLLFPSCVLWVVDCAGGMYNYNVSQSGSSFICYQIQDPLILKGKRLGDMGWARGEHSEVSSQPTDEMFQVSNGKSRWKTIAAAHKALSLWTLLCA